MCCVFGGSRGRVGLLATQTTPPPIHPYRYDIYVKLLQFHLLFLVVLGAVNPTRTTPLSPLVPPDSAPHICSVQRIDAAVRTKNRNTYVFSGAYFWNLHRSGATEAMRIREGWVGLEDDIDAALTRRKNGKTYFFKGSRYANWM